MLPYSALGILRQGEFTMLHSKSIKPILLKDAFEQLGVCLGKLSYFNAAEGSYSSEGEARNANKDRTKELVIILEDNLDVPMPRIEAFVEERRGLFDVSDWCPTELRKKLGTAQTS